MLNRILGHLSYANVMATAAVFIALGGSSYAVVRVTGSQIADGTIRGRDVAPNALGGRQIAESRIGRVPRAAKADAVGSAATRALQVKCSVGAKLAVGLCFETTPHQALTYYEAIGACSGIVGNPRLPTTTELVSFFASGAEIAPGGELTSDVFESRTVPGRLDVLVLTTERGDTTVAPAVPLDGQGGATVRMPFRCVTTPTNVP